MMADVPTIRHCYVWKPSMAPAGGTTPAGEIEPAVLAIVARWNERIPRGRCRILSGDRFRQIAECLGLLSLAEILRTIDFYAGQSWNKNKGAWKTFDHFFDLANVRTWWEKAEDSADLARKREQAQAPKDPKTAGLVRHLASGLKAPTPASEARDLRLRFDALPQSRRAQIWAQAGTELAELGEKNLTRDRILLQALAILRREPDSKP
jgi:hypothetical protein